eukprot:CAMPEP_0170195534 /NCGR_PEP_ID=MMETSP0040_2-20121228/61715_1 /TAXON_ID=641309 /ORGANISM="Lotharella oceanica, Strain CCMP622" /LENGTH=46 /DNA_ID= /DNA_START= /DNA_END= /DNA_ORIENTATION=
MSAGCTYAKKERWLGIANASVVAASPVPVEDKETRGWEGRGMMGSG